MDSALDEIEFLALSANRVETLRVLSHDAYTRRELQAEIDASQPTLSRVLNDLQTRRWVSYDGDTYTATATGELVAEAFTNLWDTLDAEADLREIIEWLPTEEMAFDFRCLTDATITTPSQMRPNAPVQRILSLLSGSERVSIFSYAFNEQSLDIIREHVIDGDQHFTGVFSPTAVDAIAQDSMLRQPLQELVAADGAEIRLHEDRIPYAVTIADDVVHFMLRDEAGVLQGAIDTDNEAVVSWAREKHAQYWQNAAPLSSADLLE
ncbi:ArsR family transcriptional regulator [Natrialba sp. PRR66]|uniref:helix-turn-helix transcriptional regulator n=1 Tax=Natrialba sp. PRR66 TaxID=3098146 RepID=UPI002B1D8A55|nr:ArsR family transcriptional regulator [Natrialba sp. PRR66]